MGLLPTGGESPSSWKSLSPVFSPSLPVSPSFNSSLQGLALRQSLQSPFSSRNPRHSSPGCLPHLSPGAASSSVQWFWRWEVNPDALAYLGCRKDVSAPLLKSKQTQVSGTGRWCDDPTPSVSLLAQRAPTHRLWTLVLARTPASELGQTRMQ